jgi:hypothetical protein
VNRGLADGLEWLNSSSRLRLFGSFLNVNNVGTFAATAAKNSSTEPQVLRLTWFVPEE